MFTTNGLAGSPPTLFQTYLTKAIPFRRRQSSASTATATSPRSWSTSFSTSPTSSITPLTPGTDSFFPSHSRTQSSTSNSYDFSRDSAISPTELPSPALSTPGMTQTYLTGHESHISCARCHADLALTSQIISKGFTGRHGRAYLVAPSASSLISAPCASSGPCSGPAYGPDSCSVHVSCSASNDRSMVPAPNGCTGSTSLPNTNTRKPVPRHLVTGMHTVADISCALCGSVLGWKYVAAEEESQRYKVGKFILETRRVAVGVCWEGGLEEQEEGEIGGASSGGGGGGGSSMGLGKRGSRGSGSWASVMGVGGIRKASTGSMARSEYGMDEEIMFDSQDEEECEDLFAGIWSPALAMRRRSRVGR